MSLSEFPVDSKPLSPFDSLSKEELILLLVSTQDTLLSKISTLETKLAINITPPKYTDAQKRAAYKWVTANCDKHNEYNRNYAKRTNYEKTKKWKSENKEACAQYQRDYRAKKKAEKLSLEI